MKKRVLLDCETTSLDPIKGGLIQLAGIFEIEGKVVDKFSYYIKPFPDDVIEDAALEVCNITREELETFPEPLTVFKEFLALLDKHCHKFNKKDKLSFMAYNSPFDYSFVQEWFKKCGEKFFFAYFSWPSIDIAGFADEYMEAQKAGWRYELPNFKLGTVSEALGINIAAPEGGGLHNAMYDIAITYKIWQIVKPT